jgi:hypothetical protein
MMHATHSLIIDGIHGSINFLGREFIEVMSKNLQSCSEAGGGSGR